MICLNMVRLNVRKRAALLAGAAALTLGMRVSLVAQVVTLVPSVTKFAGTGAGFYSGDFGGANFIALNTPSAVAMDSSGNLYVTDTGNNCVRRIDNATGQISTIAGLVTSSGGDTCNAVSNPTPTSAQGLYQPYGIAIDAQDNIYVADSGHNCVRMLQAHSVGTSTMVTVAGNCTAPNPNTTTTIAGSKTPRPAGLAIDRANALYISLRDTPDGIHQVVRHSNGTLPTDLCLIEGAAAANVSAPCAGYSIGATLNQPADIAFDPVGNLHVADTGNNCVRVLKGAVTSAAVGTCANDGMASGSAAISAPLGLAFNKRGEMYISASGTNQLLLYNEGSLQMTRLAGNPSGAPSAYSSLQNGAGSQSVPLHTPAGMTLDAQGNLFLADAENHIIRKFQSASAFGSSPIGSATSSQLLTFTINQNANLTVTPGPDYVVDSNGCSGAVTAAPSGSLSTFCTVSVSFHPTLPGTRYSPLVIRDSISGSTVTTGLQGLSLSSQPVFSPGQVATLGTAAAPTGATTDSAGNVYVLDAGSGSGTATVKAYPSGGGPATTVVAAGAGGLVNPVAIAIDAASNLYVLDNATGKIVKFPPSGSPVDFISGLTSPNAFALDADGNFYVAEGGTKHDVVKYYPGGQSQVLTGAGASTNANNITATSAQFANPSGVQVTVNGDIYISDSVLRRVYVIDSGRIIHYFAGNGTTADSQSGNALGTALLSPSELAVDVAGDVFISDPSANKVYVVYSTTAQAQNIDVLLGTGIAAYNGDGGPANEAAVTTPRAIALASAGEIYVVDKGNLGVRKITFPVPTIDFGQVAVNGTATKTQTLWNRGNMEFLRTLDFAMTNSKFANYPALTTCGQSVGLGSVCDFGFAFTPTVINTTETGDGILNDPAYNAPQTVHFTGMSEVASITGFTAPPETEVYGGVYTGTVNVTTNGGATPTGTVTFAVGPTVLCTITGNIKGTLACTKTPSSGLVPGSYTVTVSYSGDANYPAQSVTTTLTVTKAQLKVVVTNKQKLQGTANPALMGTVTGVVGSDMVNVTYSTTATTASPVGTYPITASVVFVPSTIADYYDLTVTPGTLTVNIQPVLTISSSVNPSLPNQNVTFTATVSPGSSPGTVTFNDGATTLCSAVVVAGGQAQCTVSTLALGAHTITATYTSTEGFYLTATSNFIQYVTLPTGSFAVSITPDAQYLIGPGSMTFPVTVKSLGGFAGDVKLTCSGLPSTAQCVVANPTITLAADGSVTTTLTTTTSDADAAMRAPSMPWTREMQSVPLYATTLWPMGLSGFGVLLAGIRRRKKLSQLLLIVFLTMGTVGLAGCGCPVDSYKNYVITVTASSVNGGPPDASAQALLQVAKKGSN